MKPELRGITIGFLIAICLVMVLGQSNTPVEKEAVARYQLSTIYPHQETDHIYVLDIYTGEVWSKVVKATSNFSSVGHVPQKK